MRFRTRSEAGRRLAARLLRLRPSHPVVLAFPPGGVPVGREIASALVCPLDVWVVRALPSPNEELIIGAIGEENALHVDRRILHLLGVPERELIEQAERMLPEVLERARAFRGDRPPLPLGGRTVILVSDRVVTAATVLAAVQAIRRHRPARVILAAPVGHHQELERLGEAVDAAVCLAPVTSLGRAAAWYDEPSPVPDETARALLEHAQTRSPTMNLRVEEFMTAEVVALRPHDSVAHANRQMQRAGIGHLPVVDDRRHVVGIVSQKDLVRALEESGDEELPVGDVMTRPVETIEPEAPAFQAVEILLDRHIGALPVVDQEGVLIGIVTETDFLQVAHRALHGRTGYELANL